MRSFFLLLVPCALACSDASSNCDPNAAPPAGAVGGTITVSSGGTQMTGTLDWEVSCPMDPQAEETWQFSLTTLTVYADDAGQPGMEIGATPVDFTATVSCTGPERQAQIPGVTTMQSFGPTGVADLTSACAQWKASQPGSPLNVQVEVTGSANSDQCATTFPITFRSQIGVNCP